MTTQQRIDSLVSYMQMKIIDKDWHAVSDAANDIRELEVALRYENLMQTEQQQRMPQTDIDMLNDLFKNKW